MLFDGHSHFITAGMINKLRERTLRLNPAMKGRSVKSKLHNRDFFDYLSRTPLETIAKSWHHELKRGSVDGALFIPVSDDIEEFSRFLAFFPESFFGFTYLDNPTGADAPQLLESHVKRYGMKGLKLYPPVQGLHASDSRLYPLYEKATELKIPILFHFGISTSPFFDFKYANPLDLKLPMTRFPDLNFIIAHFGAGFFREVLLLAYHADNIFVDTSGTNNWREYLPSVMPLKEIFKRSIEVYGPERVIFGTDSVVSSDGYRHSVKYEQVKIVHSLKLKSREVDQLLGSNILRLLPPNPESKEKIILSQG